MSTRPKTKESVKNVKRKTICAQREIDAYQIEIDMAKSYGRNDIVKRL